MIMMTYLVTVKVAEQDEDLLMQAGVMPSAVEAAIRERFDNTAVQVEVHPARSVLSYIRN